MPLQEAGMPDANLIPSAGIRDNYTRGTVGDFLREKIQEGSKLSVVSAYFTIYAYDALRETLDQIDHLDFLFGEPTYVNRLDPDKTAKKSFVIDEDGLELANRLQQKRVARECSEWIERKVDIRTIKQTNLLHGKMYHVANGGVEDAILGSTVTGLGLGSTGNNIEINLVVDSSRDRAELKQWFTEIWNNRGLVKDVKEDVLLYLRKLYANQSPQFIYYLTLFHLFRHYLDGTRDLDDDLRRVALPDTRVWRTLFSFQKDGAKAAINKILSFNGCILADSVGLGKTYTALAVIKYFELRNERVLVLCPKKLSRNWTIYRHPGSLNPFSDDKFRYDVLHHTDLSRESGNVNGVLLEALNWGAYDLVVIDESHNFRNNKLATQRPGETNGRRSRYQRLMEDIISAGVKTKVLLLSATPVNNQLADLRNQISFTAFADTARYIYDNLGPWAQRELKVHTGLICGDGGNAASLGRTDYDDILTNFAPIAKRRADQSGRFENQREEIDLLIATDCISEGQNLQDCDQMINYDIHWNPVRIIQRFGRIDRIGSRNETVQLVNFWPVADLDHYLGVKLRVEARMALVDLAATQTDNLLDPGQLEDLIKEDLIFRDRQLKRLKDEILDLEDLDDSVSLTDFSLDEFRLDLLRYLEANRAELEEAGEGLYAVVPPKPDLFVRSQPGAVFCLRHRPAARRAGTDPGKKTDSSKFNPLSPYYLVYVHDDGTVRFGFAQPKESMLLLRDLAAGESAAFEKLCDIFDQRTEDGANMTHYDGLLRKALASIEHTFQKRAASSLLTSRDAVLPVAGETPTSDGGDFDLVTWLVILEGSKS
jgi:hypothetical protein